MNKTIKLNKKKKNDKNVVYAISKCTLNRNFESTMGRNSSEKDYWKPTMLHGNRLKVDK